MYVRKIFCQIMPKNLQANKFLIKATYDVAFGLFVYLSKFLMKGHLNNGRFIYLFCKSL